MVKQNSGVLETYKVTLQKALTLYVGYAGLSDPLTQSQFQFIEFRARNAKVK